MLKIYLLALLTLGTTLAYGQHRKNAYAEVLGNGVLFSANFDMRFKKDQNDGLGFRVGIGGGSLPGNTFEYQEINGQRYLTGVDFNNISIVTVPLAINHVFGKTRSGFETGLGATLVFADSENGSKNDLIALKKFSVVGFLNAGYRYQPIKHGIFFHLKWTPAVNENGLFQDFSVWV